MPFERYLQSPPTQDDTASDHRLAYNGPASGRQPSVFDPSSFFSTNVQFQMPQLMLGPTLPPGGGAEVLPAGIVGNHTTVASSWLVDSTLPRDGYQYWSESAQSSEPIPVSQPLILPPFYPPAQPHREASAASDMSRSCTNHSIVERQHAPRPKDAQSTPLPISLPLSLPITAGLPVYSASGFDLLSILARVITRPNPKIVLGPVDMTCSFVVVDVRRFDSPIVYASPTFLKLSGFSEQEVMGRNCRFLQSPDGNIQRGEQRRHTAHEAVSHLRKSLAADKECQVSLINYRKSGAAFVNLVTVIPVRGGVHNLPDEADEVAYHVGFQVDLTEQPTAILQKLRDGSYMVNYSNNISQSSEVPRDLWKSTPSQTPGVSKALRVILNNQEFLKFIHFSTSTTTLSITPADRNERNDPYDGNRPLNLWLLETSPDFVHVLSLKGAFLYVSPSVRRVLGYEAEDLVGKSITDFCHEADKVPLVRELKESSIFSGPALSPLETPPSSQNMSSAPPRVVDLLFRMRVKDSSYVWVECRGKLHVEPGKGRKAIILSGRVRSIPSLNWGPLARAGGLVTPRSLIATEDRFRMEPQETELEFWALLSAGGSFLFVGTAIRDVLGWGSGEVIGRSLSDFIGGCDPAQARIVVEETLDKAFLDPTLESRSLSCDLLRKDGSQLGVEIIFFHPHQDTQSKLSDTFAAPARPLICQVKVPRATTPPVTATQLVHQHSAQVFDEFDITRGTSWQYELQQLKNANQRLRTEVEAIEARIQYATAQSRLYNTAWPNHSHDTSHQGRTSSKRAWDEGVVSLS